MSEVLSTTPSKAGATAEYLLEIPNNILRPGDYFLYFWLGTVLGVAYDNLIHAECLVSSFNHLVGRNRPAPDGRILLDAHAVDASGRIRRPPLGVTGRR